MMEHPTPKAGEFTVIFYDGETELPGDILPVKTFWQFYNDDLADNTKWFAFNLARQIVAYNDGTGKVRVPLEFMFVINSHWMNG